MVKEPQNIFKSREGFIINLFSFQPYIPTIDDTYTVQADLEKGAKETLVFHDTAGLDSTNPDLRKCYTSVADVRFFIFRYLLIWLANR